MYRFHQISDIVYRQRKQQQQQQEEDNQEEEEAQSVDLWLLQDSTMAQLMDPRLAAPAVQFLVLEVACVPALLLSACTPDSQHPCALLYEFHDPLAAGT